MAGADDTGTIWAITTAVVGDLDRDPAITAQVYGAVACLAWIAREGITLDSLLAEAPELLVMEASGVFGPDERRALDVLRRFAGFPPPLIPPDSRHPDRAREEAS